MKYEVNLVLTTTLEAENEADARAQAQAWQEQLSGSNDGSEMLANACPVVTVACPVITEARLHVAQYTKLP